MCRKITSNNYQFILRERAICKDCFKKHNSQSLIISWKSRSYQADRCYEATKDERAYEGDDRDIQDRVQILINTDSQRPKNTAINCDTNRDQDRGITNSNTQLKHRSKAKRSRIHNPFFNCLQN